MTKSKKNKLFTYLGYIAIVLGIAGIVVTLLLLIGAL